MRYFAIAFLLSTASVCWANETYSSEEFGFTMDIPSGWEMSLEEDWSDELNLTSNVLFVLNPSGVEIMDAPTILVKGHTLDNKSRSGLIRLLNARAEKGFELEAKLIAKKFLGNSFKQYRKIDTFSEYKSSENSGRAELLYEHKKDYTCFMAARAGFVGPRSYVSFHSYWKGDDPEEFESDYYDVIKSFRFGLKAKVKGALDSFSQEIEEIGEMSSEQKSEHFLERFGKIIGILFTVGTILVIGKAVLGR
ncbi:hypothetical protein ACFL3G_12445 [Planctomycetota bacterium]